MSTKKMYFYFLKSMFHYWELCLFICVSKCVTSDIAYWYDRDKYKVVPGWRYRILGRVWNMWFDEQLWRDVKFVTKTKMVWYMCGYKTWCAVRTRPEYTLTLIVYLKQYEMEDSPPRMARFTCTWYERWYLETGRNVLYIDLIRWL